MYGTSNMTIKRKRSLSGNIPKVATKTEEISSEHDLQKHALLNYVLIICFVLYRCF